MFVRQLAYDVTDAELEAFFEEVRVMLASCVAMVSTRTERS